MEEELTEKEDNDVGRQGATGRMDGNGGGGGGGGQHKRTGEGKR